MTARKAQKTAHKKGPPVGGPVVECETATHILPRGGGFGNGHKQNRGGKCGGAKGPAPPAASQDQPGIEGVYVSHEKAKKNQRAKSGKPAST